MENQSVVAKVRWGGETLEGIAGGNFGGDETYSISWLCYQLHESMLVLTLIGMYTQKKTANLITWEFKK